MTLTSYTLRPCCIGGSGGSKLCSETEIVFACSLFNTGVQRDL